MFASSSNKENSYCSLSLAHIRFEVVLVDGIEPFVRLCFLAVAIRGAAAIGRDRLGLQI